MSPRQLPLDAAQGTFSAAPPWLIDPSAISWLRGLDQVRTRTRQAVPALVRGSRRPPIGRLVVTVWRLGGAIALWWLLDRRGADRSQRRHRLAVRLRGAMEALGPTYVKLAQIISAGEGLFPDELVSEFSLCRDRVTPEPFDLVEATLRRELGRDPSEIFASIETTPIAAASIAQVHGARLVTGEDVVVKVQRSTVGTLVGRDLRVMAWLAPMLDDGAGPT